MASVVPSGILSYNLCKVVPFQIGHLLISDRHLQLAGELSVWLSRYRKAGLLDPAQLDSPLMQHFRSARELLRHRSFDIAELEILSLAANYKELLDVGKANPAFSKRVRRLLRSDRLDDYLGAQCKIGVASMLLKKEVGFICPDPPDFQITSPASGKNASIECTSVHIEKESNVDASALGCAERVCESKFIVAAKQNGV